MVCLQIASQVSCGSDNLWCGQLDLNDAPMNASFLLKLWRLYWQANLLGLIFHQCIDLNHVCVAFLSICEYMAFVILTKPVYLPVR